MIKLLKTIKHLRRQSSAAILGSAFWIIVLGLGMLSSCTKNPGLVGSKLVPDSALKVQYTDTATIRTYSITPIDTTETDHQSLAAVGSIKDPVFGITNASYYTQFIQPFTYERFGTNPQPDSLVMELQLDSIYGDTTKPITLHVYEVKGDMYNDSAYHANSTVPVYSTDYADYTFIPRMGHYYVNSAGDTIWHVVRIDLSKLSTALAEKLLHADTTYLDSNALFEQYFKGLYITASQVTSGGAMPFFTPTSTNTFLKLYYHNDSTDSLSYYLGTTDSCAYFNHFDHLYNTGSSKFISQVLQKDTTLGEQQFYVQGLNGVEAMIKFPNIKSFARMGDSISINEAKLVLPGIEAQPYLGEPASLSLIQIVSDTSYSFLADQLVEGAAFFGGSYNSSMNAYVFRITHYIQTLVQDTARQNIGLLLFVSSDATTPQRFIFSGPKPVSDTLARAKLEILYTKLPPK